jgi:K(+)-stimulated pyrophosphate-energized sodium pump
MSIVSLVIAPTLAQMHGTAGAHHGGANTHKTEMKKVEVQVVRDSAGGNTITVEGQPEQTALIEALEKDGLIDGKNFSIDLETGKLTVNGNPVDITKYQSLLKEDMKLKIKVEAKTN